MKVKERYETCSVTVIVIEDDHNGILKAITINDECMIGRGELPNPDGLGEVLWLAESEEELADCEKYFEDKLSEEVRSTVLAIFKQLQRR